MGKPSDLFEGVRGTDLRFDNPHILAEYITRAHRFSESATRIEESSERLLQGAVKATEEGVQQFQLVQRQLQVEFAGLQRVLRHAVMAAGTDIAKAVAQAHESGASCISFYGEMAKVCRDELTIRADAVNQAAIRLERASEQAEVIRQRVQAELEQLRAFNSEVMQFEHECHTRIFEARSKLFKGAGLWKRLCFVLFPPVPVLRETKIPKRPTVPTQDMGTPTAPIVLKGHGGSPRSSCGAEGLNRALNK